MDTQLTDWLSIHHVSGLGVKTYNKLLDRFTTPSAILKATDTQLKESGVRSAALVKLRSFINQTDQTINRLNEQALNWLASNHQHHIITLEDANYPPLLKLINDPPPILYVKGDLQCLTEHQIAMVGSRNPTIAGFNHAKAFAKNLSLQNLIVTSGLAAGIDNASHQGAIAANKPTIAVIGTGIDIVYPRSAMSLAKDIVNCGAIVSEFPLGTQPLAANFPRRNRIISGMSLGVLVVEAAIKSGSLITANLALDYNREIFAIPGSIDSQVSRGCNQLIKNGAKLVETTDDILSELNMLAIQHNDLLADTHASKADLSQEQQQLLSAIGHSSVNVDHIIEHTQLSVASVQEMLLDLELAGYICRSAGGYMRVPSY